MKRSIDHMEAFACILRRAIACGRVTAGSECLGGFDKRKKQRLLKELADYGYLSVLQMSSFGAIYEPTQKAIDFFKLEQK